MQTITLEQAQRQLPSLVAALETGEVFIITNDGRQVGQLLPVASDSVEADEVDGLFEQVRQVSRLDGLTISESIDEGRKQVT